MRRALIAVAAVVVLMAGAALPAGAEDAATAAAGSDSLLGPAAAAGTGASPALVAQAAPTAPAAPKLVVEGRGFGHGRGMGQWGALGYATGYQDSHQLLLDHYYGGTVAGSVDTSRALRVKLSAFDNTWFIAVSDLGRLVTPSAPGVHFQTMLVIPVGDGTFGLFSGPDCHQDGPWTFVSIVGGPVRFWVDGQDPASDDPGAWFGVCSPGGVRYYRGVGEAMATYAGPRLINELPVEQYLKGVVPREMPASWGDLGGGAGLEALKVQAVAARSYALTEDRAPGIYNICDSAACQVYGGVAFYAPDTGKRWLEDNRSNIAIGSTLGEVRVWPDGSGIARTEYSSSTGGYTAGGRFPAVADWGDDPMFQGNPNCRWHYESSLATFQQSYPAVGRVTKVAVTARNGLGEWGGRATAVEVSGTGGTVTVDGETFGYLAGLGTDWFFVDAVR